MTRTIYVELFDYSYDDTEMDLAEFKAVVDAALAKVPEGVTAKFRYERQSSDWGSSELKAYFNRPESAEETAKREAAERAADTAEAERRHRAELATYEQLKRKFEPKL